MLIKNGSTPRIVFLMVDATDDETAETGLSPTVQISKSGGVFANVTNSVTEIGNGWYYVDLTATETDTDGPLIVRATATGADEWRDVHQVYTDLAADTVKISGDDAAADNLEADYDGTGYNKSASIIGTVSNVVDKTGYALTASERISIADAILGRDFASVTGAATRSVLNALRALRNKVTVAAGIMTVYQENDSTTAWTASVATDAAANLITEIDPT